MDSSVAPKDEIWFLRVCHHISHAVYWYARVASYVWLKLSYSVTTVISKFLFMGIGRTLRVSEDSVMNTVFRPNCKRGGKLCGIMRFILQLGWIWQDIEHIGGKMAVESSFQERDREGVSCNSFCMCVMSFVSRTKSQHRLEQRLSTVM
jgi:hypothetical protein